jgi:hypothetical protein
MVRIYLKREPARECLEGRLAGMRQALALEPEAPIGDDALTGEAILAVAPVEAYDLTLGTGGPADWLRVFVEHGDLNRVEYHFADWGAHERVELTPDEEATLLAWINRFARVWESSHPPKAGAARTPLPLFYGRSLTARSPGSGNPRAGSAWFQKGFFASRPSSVYPPPPAVKVVLSRSASRRTGELHL